MTKHEIIMNHVRQARTINGLYELADFLRDMADAGYLEEEDYINAVPVILEKVGEFGRIRAGLDYDEGRA